MNEFQTLFPALLLLGWFGFLIFIQPDLGTAFTLVLTGGVMLYVAGVRLRYFAALVRPGAVLAYQAVIVAAYRRDETAAREAIAASERHGPAASGRGLSGG